MTCLRTLLPAPPVPASQMKTPMFEQSAWANARSTDDTFRLCFSDRVYSRWQVVRCLLFGLLLAQKENRNMGMVPILSMPRKETLVNGSALALSLFNVKSVTYIALRLGFYQSASLTSPGGRVWPHQCSLQPAELSMLLFRSKCHHASSTSTCLSLSYFYIFF